jgi:hypothetical protein
MHRLTTLTASALAVGALAPAAASASGVELRGAPTLRLIDRDQAKLTFATDEKLPRKRQGGYKVYVAVHGKRVGDITLSGRHGHDFRYEGVMRAARTLTVGERYTLRIRIAGQDDIVRKVKLHERKA